MDEDGNLVVVADGTYHPTEQSSFIHGPTLMLSHYKVSIDLPYEEHSTVKLLVPSPDGATLLGDAKGYFVNWPRSMVLFEHEPNEIRTTTSQSKEGVSSCDPLRTQDSDRTPVQGVTAAKKDLGVMDNLEECWLLQMLMLEDNHDTVRVLLKAPLLYLKEDQEIRVTSTDVHEVVRGACINMSVIHVYIRYLVEELNSRCEVEYVTFLCPHRISGTECKRSFLEVVGYVKRAFMCELQNKDSHTRLVLVPYNENNHWILMAIDLSEGGNLSIRPTGSTSSTSIEL